MLIDPHIAIIRTSDESPALYEGVMRRVADRVERPQGVLMHYTTMRDGHFVVCTVFRDNASMLDGFIGFSAPEAQNEMVATGRAIDLTRDEYPLERMLVAEGVEAQPFSLVPSGEIAACSSEMAEISVETYRALVDKSGQHETPVPGRLATIAYRVGNSVHAVDFWESREIGNAYYEEHIYPVYERLHPGRITPETREASWLKLHNFLVSAPLGDPTRSFMRSSEGPFEP